MPHSPKLNILAGEKSVLFLSNSRADFALVFIHGFGGSATGTWAGFEKINSSARSWDVFFYGYPSWAGQAVTHAEFFRTFLYQLCLDPGKIYPELNRSYKHVLVVAHSLGAIVTRRALLNACLRKETFVDRVSFILFAPAHLGATEITTAYGKALDTIPGLVPEGVPGKNMVNIAALATRVSVAKSLRDMLAGSVTLRQLAEETSRRLERFRATCQDPDATPHHLVARRVVYGFGEDIVDANRFGEDPVPEFYDIGSCLMGSVVLSAEDTSRWIPGSDHLAICKPTAEFVLPLSIVREELAKIDPLSSTNDENSLGSAETIEEDLVPDPEGDIAFVRQWAEENTDPDIRAWCFRNHRLPGHEVKKPDELRARAGFDLLLDRVSILELASLLGYHVEPSALAPIDYDLLTSEPVKPYYENYYPTPLVGDYIRRLTGDGVSDNKSTKTAERAFLRFTIVQTALLHDNVRKFRLLLEDYRLLEPGLPNNHLTWLDLLALLSTPDNMEKALVAAPSTNAIAAAHGYRSFLQFLIGLEDFCRVYQDCRLFVRGVRRFYTYWLLLFKQKFQEVLERSLSSLPADAIDSSDFTTNRNNLQRILHELPIREIEEHMALLDRQAQEMSKLGPDGPPSGREPARSEGCQA